MSVTACSLSATEPPIRDDTPLLDALTADRMNAFSSSDFSKNGAGDASSSSSAAAASFSPSLAACTRASIWRCMLSSLATPRNHSHDKPPYPTRDNKTTTRGQSLAQHLVTLGSNRRTLARDSLATYATLNRRTLAGSVTNSRWLDTLIPRRFSCGSLVDIVSWRSCSHRGKKRMRLTSTGHISRHPGIARLPTRTGRKPTFPATIQQCGCTREGTCRQAAPQHRATQDAQQVSCTDARPASSSSGTPG
jgi:hypothetical protein